MSQVVIRQHKSAIGEKEPVRRTLSALGLRKTGQTVAHEDSAALRGMLRKVAHLVEVAEEVEQRA
jgi:large subunit ribosomal protein L30